MSNTNKIIIAVLDFLLCALIGYMGMNFLSRVKGPSSGGGGGSAASYTAGATRGGSSIPGHAAPFPGGGGESIVQPAAQTTADAAAEVVADDEPVLSDASEQMPPVPADDGTVPTKSANLGGGLASAPEILSVSAPVYDRAGGVYVFEVTAGGQTLTYTVADARKNDLQSNATGSFSVPPCASGKYYVYVTDRYGNKSDYTEVRGCFFLVKAVSKEELQQILNAGKSQNAIDADFSNRVSPGCRFEFVGINPDEDAPQSYNEILNRIRMRTWSSVTVLSVTHSSETNKLIRAKIQVNY